MHISSSQEVATECVAVGPACRLEQRDNMLNTPVHGHSITLHIQTMFGSSLRQRVAKYCVPNRFGGAYCIHHQGYGCPDDGSSKHL
jgi:hypothetical protein